MATISIPQDKRTTDCAAPSPHCPPRQQLRVLELSARGMPAEDVAVEMGLSVRTVHYHLYEAYRALRVENLQSAYLVLIRLGYLPCPCGANTCARREG